jgi:hypothetical protein
VLEKDQRFGGEEAGEVDTRRETALRDCAVQDAKHLREACSHVFRT